MKKADIIKCQHGTVGMMALFFMLFIGVVGSGMYNISLTDLSIYNNFSDGVKAQYLAEAGIQCVAAELTYDLSVRQGTLYNKVSVLLNGQKTSAAVHKDSGQYTYTILHVSGTSYLVKVTGKVNKSYRTVYQKFIWQHNASNPEVSVLNFSNWSNKKEAI